LMELHELRGTSRFEPREVHMRYVLTTWINRCHDGRRYEGLGCYLHPADHAESLFLQLCREGWMALQLIRFGEVSAIRVHLSLLWMFSGLRRMNSIKIT